ncbi:hypothetical protein [Staphylococcus pseudintermedius]|uniref:hypothetical protein n=1 Tax=Staphylococcus pseudintermedius TaxID=283734 RepID=UPI001BDDEC25|nr:hypothetical protein [Staphylococcus pseudintermedius]
MKIKVKKEMNLPQFIEWAWENSIKHKEFTGSRNGIVEFDFRGWVRTDLIEPDEIFTVEMEEEITPDTIIPNMASVWTMNNKPRVTMYHECTIQDFINDAIEYPSASNEKLMLYMVNDDRTMTLIYKNGEMVG